MPCADVYIMHQRRQFVLHVFGKTLTAAEKITYIAVLVQPGNFYGHIVKGFGCISYIQTAAYSVIAVRSNIQHLPVNRAVLMQGKAVNFFRQLF